jgi:SAM-dependent methyltransferase
MSLHPDAADGFSAGAEAYERGRPSYPAAAMALLRDELGVGPGSAVLDLGAGTGKLTRLLAATGADVRAVEPVEEMRAQLEAAVAGIEVMDGLAEAIPLPEASVDVVAVGQAFHWFEPRGALAEIARVVRHGGGLAMLWNVRDESVPWVRELTEVIHWRDFARGHYGDRDWAAVVAANASFTPLEHHSFPYVQPLDRAGLLDRIASVSYVAALPDDERAAVLAKVANLVVDFPPQFDLPYVTDVWTCHRT